MKTLFYEFDGVDVFKEILADDRKARVVCFFLLQLDPE